MEKKFIKDKDGNIILPITHTSAVKDDNGNSLESVFGNFKDEVNNTIDTRLDALDAAIELLNGSEVIVVDDHTAVTTPDSQKIYREQGTTSYTDWMYQDNTWEKIATYDFPGIDGVLDVSAQYPTSGVEGGNTYTLEGALAVLNANLSASKKKGGMSVKFVLSSDNKYVQYFLTSTSWSTDVDDWVEGGGGSGDGAYDISAKNNGATYNNLTAALGANGANVPSAVRNGGMSIKYIESVYADYSVVVTEGLETQPTGTALQSAPSITDGVYKASQLSAFTTLPSTVGTTETYYIAITGDTTTYTKWVVTKINEDSGEYVQYRLMAEEWSTAVQDWQGVDTVPIENSRNLAESKDVARIDKILEIGNDKKFVPKEPLDIDMYFYKYGRIANNRIYPSSSTGNYYLVLIPLQKGEKIYYKLRSQNTANGLLGDYVNDNNCQILENATDAVVDSSYTAPKDMILAVGIDKRAPATISKDQVTLGGSERLDKIEENINALQKGQEVLELSEDLEEKWNPVPVSILENKYINSDGYSNQNSFNCTDWVYFKKGSLIRIRSNNTSPSVITFALKSPIDNVVINHTIVPGTQDVSTLTELTLEYDGYYALSYVKASGFVFEYYGTSGKFSSKILDDISEAVIERVQDDMTEDYIVGYIGLNGNVSTSSGYRRKEFYIRAGSSIKATVNGHPQVASLAKKITDTSYSVILHSEGFDPYSFEYNVTESGYYCFSSREVSNASCSILIEGNNVRANTEDIAAIFEELDARSNAEFIQSFQFGRLFENIACIGDSMSVGSLSESALPDVGSNCGASWLSCLFKMWGCRSRMHYARGGTSCYMWLNGDQEYNLAAMLADPNIYNCYIIAYGHNDSPSAGAGTASDTAAPVTVTDGVPSCPDGYTFAAYYKAVIDQVRLKAPHAMILCLSEYDGVMMGKSAYRQAIIDIADLYYEQGDHLIYHLETGGVPDSALGLGTHYSTIGYQYIAKRVNEETNKVIYEHRAEAEIKAFGSWNTPNERYLRYDTSTSLT